MGRFHLMHVIADPKLHGLRGYQEVVETIGWGLSQLGHEVSHAVNRFDPDATNILFGAHMLSADKVAELPANSITYNLEQVRNLDPANFAAAQRDCLERFEIWEYCAANLPTWQRLRNRRVRLVPIGYAPTLSRIPRPATQDIDVLIYGVSGQQRLAAFHRLSYAGLTTLFVSGLYGEARDQLIARARLVLNVNVHAQSQIFEIVRVSYLFANRKAVVAIKGAETFVEEDIAAGVWFTSLERLVADCEQLLGDEAARAALESRALEIIAQRDVRAILRQALAGE
jgi:hypothetical protein